jgi:hypothetical protein
MPNKKPTNGQLVVIFFGLMVAVDWLADLAGIVPIW